MTTTKTASKTTDTPAEDPQATDTPEAPQPFRKTLWAAGASPLVPDYSILVPGKRRPYKFQNGKLVVTDAGDYDFILRAKRGQVFEEDWPNDKPAPMNKVTGFAPRSFAAQQAHRDLLDE